MQRRGFSIVDVLTVVAIIGVLIGIVLPVLGRTRATSRQIKDETQVRSIHQGMIAWSAGKEDRYPLPSQLDRGNTTVVATGGAVKDLTRHIVSVLIFNGYFGPQACVSPAEVSRNITPYTRFEFRNPGGAPEPAKALWDPAFRATPNDATIGANAPGDPGGWSYGMSPPIGARLGRWSHTFRSTEAIIGNRGPDYVPSGSPNGWLLSSNYDSHNGTVGVGVGSNALLIHGGKYTWEGNIAYSDNHVVFEQTPIPESTQLSLPSTPNLHRKDNLFVNENDSTGYVDSPSCSLPTTGHRAGDNTNNFLRAWNGGIQPVVNGEVRPLTQIQPWYD